MARPEFFVITFMLLYAAGSCTLGDCNSDQIICAFKAYSLIVVVEGSFSKYQIIPRELAIGFSVGDIILVVLDHVVGPAPVAEETVLDDLHDKIRSLPLCHVRAEPVFQKFDCLATKTGQACVQHECNQGDDCIHIGAHSQITSDTHLHEPLEGCGFHFAPHNHHHLVCQLDVWFPAKVATR